MKYVVKKRNKIYDVLELEYPIKGYKFNSKSEDIKSITLVDAKLISKVLDIKINTMFTRLLMIVNDAFNSDDNPSGTAIALDEIALVRSTILTKYHKLLDEKKEELYLKKLALLEQEMFDKMVVYQYDNYKTSGKGR
jgi:hypothetical protein